MSVLHVDAVGGAAGDMLLAALLDAGASPRVVDDAVSSVLGRRVEITTSEEHRRGLRALALSVRDDALARPTGTRTPSDLIHAVERAALAPAVRSRSVSVLTELGHAEARVHGVEPDELELEELGEDDTLIDVVGIVAALESLEVDRMTVSSLPMPSPSASSAHMLPAPVTLELLRGFSLRSLPAGAETIETVTPTAAAVLAALGEPATDAPTLTLHGVGYGAGARDPIGFANVVRVLVGAPATHGAMTDRRLLVIEANVDDMPPELVPDAFDALRSAGALDAWATPIVMKHGRPALTISALCVPDVYVDVRRAFFEATTTFGVRVHEIDRPELERRTVEVELEDGGPRIRVKIGLLGGRAVTAKPEHADVVEAARKLDESLRSVHARASAIAYGLLDGTT